MYWISYHASHYQKNGAVNRKAECDAYFMEGLIAGFFQVVKSAMVGSTYYAAIRSLKRQIGTDENGKAVYEPIPETEQVTWAAVFLTQTDTENYNNFSYKGMDETCGIREYDCPEEILKLLSPTDSELANYWREQCWKRNANRKFLDSAPVRTKIITKIKRTITDHRSVPIKKEEH